MEGMELAYVGLQVSDRAAMDSFLGEVVGLVPGVGGPSFSTWRNDDKARRVIVEDGPADDAVYFGIEHRADHFDAAVERLAASGVEVTEGSAEERAGRGVERLAYATTPWGSRVELVSGLADASEPFDSPLVPGGFHTHGVGFGHLVFQTAGQERFEETHRYITEGLGFTQSDWFEGKIGPGEVYVRFYHCNPRHHTLAVALLPIEVPQALNHLMVETVSEDNVGSAFDRAWHSEVQIDQGIGRHDNDRMFSFYLTTPAGFRLEFGTGAREIVEPWTENRRYDRPSVWGHLPVRRPESAAVPG